MSTYVRDDKAFRLQLAARANRLAIGRLAMARLADELRESLTADQRVGVCAALASGDAQTITELTVSQRNALFVLIAANEPDALLDYLKGQQ